MSVKRGGWWWCAVESEGVMDYTSQPGLQIWWNVTKMPMRKEPGVELCNFKLSTWSAKPVQFRKDTWLDYRIFCVLCYKLDITVCVTS